MNLNKINEVMKKRLDEGFFGNIQEEEELDIKSKLTSLLKSGTLDNIELAFMIAQGQDFDIDALTEELFDLKFWMDNIDDIPQTSKVESLSFLLSKTSIDLPHKELSKLSESIGNFHNLQRLDLYDNNLGSLPESIGNLRNLQWLDLSDNNLSSLPEFIGNFQSLQELWLGNNGLTTIPESIGNLHELKQLYLSFNNLKGIPESIGNLQYLQSLYLSDNNLSRLPESIDNLRNLKELFLVGNKLSKVEINRIEAMLPNCQVHD